MSEIHVRVAEPHDLVQVNEIYNGFVEDTAITFDTRLTTADERRPWFERFGAKGRYRLVVAERDGRLLGYAGSLPFRSKAAYDTSVELTIYLRPEAQGHGLGERLYRALFDSLAGEDIHLLLAGITLPNAASVRLHERLAFEPVGVFREVGFKLGRYWDVAWYQRRFEWPGA